MSFLKKHTRILIIIGSILFYTLITFNKGYVIGSDGLSYYAHVRSFFIDRDLNYENEFKEYNPNNCSYSHGWPPV